MEERKSQETNADGVSYLLVGMPLGKSKSRQCSLTATSIFETYFCLNLLRNIGDGFTLHGSETTFSFLDT